MLSASNSDKLSVLMLGPYVGIGSGAPRPA
jgi:hypothetical protein